MVVYHSSLELTEKTLLEEALRSFGTAGKQEA